MVAGYAAPGYRHQTSRLATLGRWIEVRATSGANRLGRDGFLVLALPSLIVLTLGVVLVSNPVAQTEDGPGTQLAAAASSIAITPTTTPTTGSPSGSVPASNGQSSSPVDTPLVHTPPVDTPPVDVAGATEARNQPSPNDSQLLALAVEVMRSELEVARSENQALRNRIAELESRVDRLGPGMSTSGR